MRHVRFLLPLMIVSSLLVACVSLAPGAAQVRFTKSASDVWSCSGVGNVQVPADSSGQIDLSNAAARFRNQVVALGGNTAFITSESRGVPVEGVAYHCPESAHPGSETH